MDSYRPMKKVLILSVVILSLGAYFALSQKGSPLHQSPPPTPQPVTSPGSAPAAAERASPTPSPAPTEDSSSSLNPQFRNWFTHESDNVESSVANPQQKEQELRALVSKMTPPELNFLAQRAVDMSGAAKARIFATYLLTLEPALTQSQLLQVAVASLTVSPQAPVHSPEETLGAQERALRRMALDALFERARLHPEFRPELFAALQQIKDESLKKYAEKRKRELP